ncbi:MAG: hypothetical protein OEN20_01215 [Gammaproteobacteria bacterium]|nr:hypothetical protein [Gammaproteobacteria bacterium]
MSGVAIPVQAAVAPTFDDLATILRERRVICHAGAAAPLGLHLDTLTGLQRGSSNGTVATPGDIAGSELLRRLRGQSLPRMPRTGPPCPEPQQTALIEAWIAAGGERAVVVPGTGASPLLRRVRRQSTPRTPFDGPPHLSDEEIRLISDWIAQGAPDAQGQPSPLSVGARIPLEGIFTARWQLYDVPLAVDAAPRIRDNPVPGDNVEVRGAVTRDDRILATRIRVR